MRINYILPSVLLVISTHTYAKPKVPQAKALFEMAGPGDGAPSIEMDAAFKAAFGKEAVSGKRSIDDASLTFAPIGLIQISSDIHALISLGQDENQGHASSGVNAIHYLKKTANGYTRVGEWFGLGSVGTFGMPALRWAFTDKLGKNPYWVTEGGGTWQGYTCGWTTLTELAPTAPADRAFFPSDYSNGGAVEKGYVTIESAISAAVPDKSFTVSFTAKGMRNQTWLRSGEKYILKGKNKVPEC